tara:strand:- start:74 stop:721 length:648 start_codon:yes stop_codon:yes gene_type:complete
MNIINKLLIFLLFHSATFSENEINLSLNSDSIWRGISQNNGEPTLGANINFSLDNGFFSGAWIESCCSETSSYPTREIGFYAGYEKSFTKNLALSLNYVGTNYPNSKIDNYDEIELNFSFYDFEISYFKGLDNFPDYYELSYNYDFLNNSLYLIYGNFDSYKNDNKSNGSNYSFGINTLIRDFTLSFFYYYFDANDLKDLDDDGVVFSLSKRTSF